MSTEIVPKWVFEKRYAESGMATNGKRAMPCSCSDGGGPWHWAMVNDDPDSIEDHLAHEACLQDIRQIETFPEPIRGVLLAIAGNVGLL